MTQLSAETRKTLDDVLITPDVDGLVQLVTDSVNDVSRNDHTTAIIHYVSDCMTTIGASRGASYVVTVANCIDGVPGLHGVTFASAYCQLQMDAAACCAAMGAFKEALMLDSRLLHAPGVETGRLLAPQRLALAQRAMLSAMEMDDADTGDLAARFGSPAFRQLSRDATLPSTDMTAYLSALALSLVSRGRFLEAARAAYQRYLVTHDRVDLKRSVCCSVLAGADPARTSLLNLLHAIPEVAELGPLFDVLERTHAALLLTEADVDAVVRALNVRHLRPQDVQRGLIEHNMDAISRFYDNIRIGRLCGLLGGLTEPKVLDIVVDMVRSGRLVAKIDESSGFVFFRVMESKSALAEWDDRIGAICNTVSYAGDLIAKYRPDLYAYAQSTKEH